MIAIFKIIKILRSPSYMGQYGNILKIDINQNSKKHFGVYVKYADPCEASIAILVKAIN
jgi:hypothetical protein